MDVRDALTVTDVRLLPFDAALAALRQRARDRTGASERVAQAATDAAAHIGLECAPDPTAIAVTDAYVGTGFGFPDPETLSALRLLAGNEGILVDPTYTGKAFACLIDLVRKGRFGADEDIVFVHTGGTPLLFAYGEELLVG